MPAEPITLFSHEINPAGVIAVLRQLAPDLQVIGPEDNWERVTIPAPRRLFRKAATLTFTHDPSYYAAPKWATQLSGMQGYFSRFRENELTARVMLLIQSFRFALGTLADPLIDIESDDPRCEYLLAVARHLDATIFTPSSLRDSSGRILLHASKDPDPQAVIPPIHKTVPAGPRDQLPRSQGGAQPDPDSPPPPTPERVARRSLSLAGICGRALLEQEDPNDPGVETTRRRILDWVSEIGVEDELEPDEWKLLQHPLRSLPEQDVVNATWRLEGLAVLAWALKRFDLPPYDKLVQPGKLLPTLYILNAEGARTLLAGPDLRQPEELQRLSHQLFALHWRLRNYHLKPEAMDFSEFARTAWFGPLDITGLRLIQNDIALGDVPLSAASLDAFHTALSSAMERHLAINWLNGGSVLYSETDVST